MKICGMICTDRLFSFTSALGALSTGLLCNRSIRVAQHAKCIFIHSVLRGQTIYMAFTSVLSFARIGPRNKFSVHYATRQSSRQSLTFLSPLTEAVNSGRLSFKDETVNCSVSITMIYVENCFSAVRGLQSIMWQSFMFEETEQKTTRKTAAGCLPEVGLSAHSFSLLGVLRSGADMGISASEALRIFGQMLCGFF